MHEFADAAAWDAWLAEHHSDEGGTWLKIGKKGSPAPLLPIRDALDVALCWGWIDSTRRGFDEHCFLQRYSRRRRGSPWSQVNVERVAELTAEGRMRPPGLAEVASARADGRWASAVVAQRNVTVPPELAAALAAEPRAAARFDALGKTDRYQLLLPLLKARTDAGRARCVARAVALLMDGNRST